MARKKFVHADGTIETWDDATCLYVLRDPSGVEIESRALTGDELSMLDPRSGDIRALQDIVDQLILDSLMGGM